MSIRYVDEVVGPYVLYHRDVSRKGKWPDTLFPGQNADGYGDKIITDLKLRFHGAKKEYRVYCTQWSNAGSCWILYNGEKLFLRGSDPILHSRSGKNKDIEV